MSLGRFLVRRTLQGLLVVWGVITVVFLLRFLSPGDPVTFIAPLDASPELRQRIAEDLGCNRPIHVQYADYIGGGFPAHVGHSFQRGLPANEVVWARVPATIELAIAASVVAFVLSIPLGVVAATRRHSPADYGATLFSLVGISTPNFWLGIMLILVLAVQLDLFPTSQRPVGFLEAWGYLIDVDPLDLSMSAPLRFGAFADTMGTWLWHIALPAVTLGTYFTALITRLTRSGMLDALGKEYVTAARAKGLPETLVRYRHALRNTLIPIITVLGLQLGTLIGGAVITEQVFAWPGLGSLLIDAINDRDWPVIQASLIVIGVSFVVINIAVDAIYGYLNPKVGYE